MHVKYKLSKSKAVDMGDPENWVGYACDAVKLRYMYTCIDSVN